MTDAVNAKHTVAPRAVKVPRTPITSAVISPFWALSSRYDTIDTPIKLATPNKAFQARKRPNALRFFHHCDQYRHGSSPAHNGNNTDCHHCKFPQKCYGQHQEKTMDANWFPAPATVAGWQAGDWPASEPRHHPWPSLPTQCPLCNHTEKLSSTNHKAY